MYIVVGLGNAGRKYEHTRHNVGFDVLEVLSQKYDIPIRKLRCKAAVGEGTIRGERVVLAQPQTFMNLSGESVVELMNWYKAEPEHLIVVYDDVDLPEGAFFLADIYGLEVRDAQSGAVLGKVADVLTLPANNVYVVRGGERELMIPAVPQFITETNPEGGYLRVNLIEGL